VYRGPTCGRRGLDGEGVADRTLPVAGAACGGIGACFAACCLGTLEVGLAADFQVDFLAAFLAGLVAGLVAGFPTGFPAEGCALAFPAVLPTARLAVFDAGFPD